MTTSFAPHPPIVDLQLVGQYGRDDALLDVGERVEALLAPLAAERPALAA
ncbi:MAG: hypothetical protein M9907_11750 [Burkholderiaceae bacterium]|nr:hypothetical protein [Burkholderiaceae bacterium]